ncbi:MAG: hypothetical protein J6X70_08860 [Muribaculaceae bacterium]|nr:hypothetical protein [Muribaculaceae bacterium]
MSRLSKARVAHEAARFFSTVLSPLLMPSYGVFLMLWISPLCLKPVGERFKLLLITLGITCVLPMMIIAVLHNLNIINNKRLDRRKERLVPYIFGTLCYLGAACYMAYVHEPSWLVMFLGGGALACAVSTLVNVWWKISAHSAGIAGVLALIWNLRVMHLEVVSSATWFLLLLFTLLLCGMVGTARLVLRRHTLGQVLAGWANGFLCVTLLMRLFG